MAEAQIDELLLRLRQNTSFGSYTQKVNHYVQLKTLNAEYDVRQVIDRSSVQQFATYCCQLKVGDQKFYCSLRASRQTNSDKDSRDKVIKYSKELAAKHFIFDEYSEEDRDLYFSCPPELNVNYVKNKISNNQKRKNDARGREKFRKVCDSNVIVDTERSGGPDISELIQISYCKGRVFTDESCESLFVWPQGGISRFNSLHTHKITKDEGSNCLRYKGRMMETLSLSEALTKFLEYLKQTKEETGYKVNLIFHGSADIVTIFNSFSKIGKLEELQSIIHGQIDFEKAIRTDSEIMRMTNGGSSLTRIDPRRRNLVEVLTDHTLDPQRVHDAKYDVQLLMMCYWSYLDNHFVSSVTEFRRLWLEKCEHLMIRVRLDVAKRYRKINKNQADSVIVFNGF